MASTLPSPPETLTPEQSLARERAILQYVVDNVPYCIFWKDRDSRYLGCNKNFAALDGRSDPRELIGKTDYDMAWSEHADDYRRFDREIMRRGVPLLNQEELTHDDQGRRMVILTSKVPLRNETGQVIGLLGIIVDITERKQIEIEGNVRAGRRPSTIPAAPPGRYLRFESGGDDTPLEAVANGSAELPHVLVVEHDRAVRRRLGQLLGGRYRVSAVENGRRALRFLEQEAPDVIVSAAAMPELDGLTLVDIVKKDERYRHIPIILLTARGGQEQLVSALTTGADDYIAQPFTATDLLARVRAAYRLGNTYRQLAAMQSELACLRQHSSAPEPVTLSAPDKRASSSRVQLNSVASTRAGR